MKLFRTILIVTLAVSLASWGSASHAGTMAAHHHHAADESAEVGNYADLVVDAAVCAAEDAGTAAPTPSGHDSATTCCTACTTASVIPQPPVPAFVPAVAGQTFTPRSDALVASTVPLEPEIPKPL